MAYPPIDVGAQGAEGLFSEPGGCVGGLFKPAAGLESDSSQPTVWQRSGRYLATHPHLVLIGVLIFLILMTGAVESNYLSINGLRNSALFAVPIGVLAAGQTILMLTGGIDLSVGFVATAVAFVMASLVTQMDPVIAIPIATPACGINAMPRYFCTAGSAPYLPAAR